MLRLLLSALGKLSFVIFMNTMSFSRRYSGFMPSARSSVRKLQLFPTKTRAFAVTLDLAAASFMPLEFQNKPQVTELTTASVLARYSSHEVEYSEFRM